MPLFFVRQANCAGHLLANVQKHGAAQSPPEYFHQKMFWALQGSRTKEQAAANLKKFKICYPKVYRYLMALDRDKWIWCFQVAAGASTFEEKTNNMSEHAEGSAKAKGIRASFPLDAAALVVEWMLEVVSAEQALQRPLHLAGHRYVPHAEAVRLELLTRVGLYSASGARPIVKVTAPISVVDLDGGNDYVRTVDLDNLECSCLRPQDRNLPCICMAAAAVHVGMTINDIMEVGSDQCYKVQAAVLAIELAPATMPTDAALDLARQAEDGGDDLEVAQWACRDHRGELPATTLCLPPLQTKTDHKGKKNGRFKVGRGRGSGASTKGNTVKAKTVAAAKHGGIKARQGCSTCVEQGRFGEQIFGHKGGGLCPLDDRNKPKAVVKIDLSLYSGSDTDEAAEPALDPVFAPVPMPTATANADADAADADADTDAAATATATTTTTTTATADADADTDVDVDTDADADADADDADNADADADADAATNANATATTTTTADAVAAPAPGSEDGMCPMCSEDVAADMMQEHVEACLGVFHPATRPRQHQHGGSDSSSDSEVEGAPQDIIDAAREQAKKAAAEEQEVGDGIDLLEGRLKEILAERRHTKRVATAAAGGPRQPPTRRPPVSIRQPFDFLGMGLSRKRASTAPQVAVGKKAKNAPKKASTAPKVAVGKTAKKAPKKACEIVFGNPFAEEDEYEERLASRVCVLCPRTLHSVLKGGRIPASEAAFKCVLCRETVCVYHSEACKDCGERYCDVCKLTLTCHCSLFTCDRCICRSRICDGH